MADKVRLAAHQANRTVRILMDLGGPKLRTGPVVDGPAVVKLRPVRDAFGRVTQSARLGLVPAGSGQSVAGSQVSLGVDARWLSRLKVGERIDLADARSARRRLVSSGTKPACSWNATVPLTCAPRPGCGCIGPARRRTGPLSSMCRWHRVSCTCGKAISWIWCRRVPVMMRCRRPRSAVRRVRAFRARCPMCSRTCARHRIWFDDGRIGGEIRRCEPDRVEVEITEARAVN
jgi:pyruvate kinase